MMTIDQVTDNGDNSLTIIGHDTDGTSYTTSMGRKSDLPADESKQMAYYQAILQTALPVEQPVLFQASDYTPPSTSNTDDSTVKS